MSRAQPEPHARAAELRTWVRVLVDASSACLALALLAGCATGTAESGSAASLRSPVPVERAARWCTAVLRHHAGQFEGITLQNSVATTVAAAQAWRDVQGESSGFVEDLQSRFPALASLAPEDHLAVCLFTGEPRPISQPAPARLPAVGMRVFVTPSGAYVVDAIGPHAALAAEIARLR